MRALVMKDKALRVDDVADPEPQKGQVLVRTLSCGICASDTHLLAHGERLAQWSRDFGGRSRTHGAWFRGFSRDPPRGAHRGSLRLPSRPLSMCDAVGLYLMNEKGTEHCWSTDFHLGLTGVSLTVHQY